MSTLTDSVAAPANLGVRFGNHKFMEKVTSLRAASQLWCKVRDNNNLGASESPKVTVWDLDAMTPIARISYNGRVWDNDGKEIAL
jgi:hypothetical protein